MQDALDRAAAALGLAAAPRWVGEVGSTQDVARAWAREGRPHGLSAVTDRQAGGRGRLGRAWESPPGSGLQLSVLLRPALAPARLALVSLAAAVALRDVLGERFGIKWPNDLLAPDGRKVAGVLCEAELAAGRVDAVIVGVGINVAAAPPLDTATCLAAWGAELPAAPLAAAVVRALLDRVDQLATAPAGVLDAWRRGDALRGRPVQVAGHAGVADGVADDGSLWLRTDDGARRRVTAGDVALVHTEIR